MKRTLAALLALAAVAAPAFAQPPAAAPAAAPAAEQRQASAPVITPHAMVTAANPLAANAGLKVLRAGGSALDAAVAVQAVLGLVEPQSSGVGGGAFLMYYEASTGVVTSIDGRETAPAGATPDMFLDEHGKPLPFVEAVRSGRSTGVPGAIAMLSAAHARLGTRPWKELFQPAIRAATQGFRVPERLASYLGEGSPFPPTTEIQIGRAHV